MSRMDDWNIDLHDLESQIEEALDNEYQRGFEDGADSGNPGARTDLDDARDTFERLRLRILVDVHYEHDPHHAIQFCPYPLCKAYVEHRDSLGVSS